MRAPCSIPGCEKPSRGRRARGADGSFTPDKVGATVTISTLSLTQVGVL